ncbi:MAG: hypothetical protein ACREPT_14265 [Rudaea sp.]
MTSFPGALDTFVNPGTADKTNGSGPGGTPTLHHAQHANLNDAMAAVQLFLIGVQAWTGSGTITKRRNRIAGNSITLATPTSPIDGQEVFLTIEASYTGNAISGSAGATVNGRATWSLPDSTLFGCLLIYNASATDWFVLTFRLGAL